MQAGGAGVHGRDTSRGLGTRWNVGHQPALADKLRAAPSSRSNLPCGQQRRYRRREAGDVGHPGTPGPSALASLQGSSRSPDNSTLDVQLGDRQAEPALSPSGPELAACT